MTKTEMKKASLINFIKYKMEHGGDTKEELVKIMESGYVYDTTRGDKVNIIEMAREIERKETAKKILTYLWKQRNVIGQLMIFEEDLIKLARQYGVEVEE